MKIVVLDANTLGEDISLEMIDKCGECFIYKETLAKDVKERIEDAEVIILNKIKLNRENLSGAKNLKLICVTATGYDNIDVEYCKTRNIAVCNVVGYSSHSVAQNTLAMVLALSVNLLTYNNFVRSGEYSKSGVANRLTPVYHELSGKTWGIIGYGNIGKEVGETAKALGCRLLYTRQNNDNSDFCVDIKTLLREADIITIHTPLNSATKGLVNKETISLMKDGVLIVNAARGAVTDEKAIAEAIKSGKIGSFGSDVYSEEPFSENHPFYEIMNLPNVILTPHMAWGSYEARVRCIEEITKNIEAYKKGEARNRVDL